MKVIYNKYIPSKDFNAFTLFGLVFVRKELKPEANTITFKWTLNHESIHIHQERELLYIFFYLIYGIEYLVNLVKYKGNKSFAYRYISFEREAFAHERDPKYLKHRPPYAQWRKK